MLEKLARIEQRYEELGQKLADPEVLSDRNLLHKYSKEHRDLQDVVRVYREYKKAQEQLNEANEIIQSESDVELVEMAREESTGLAKQRETLHQELRLLLLPKDPNDEKNIILEIRAGAGGDEAGIFAGDLFRMYSRYAEDQKFKMEIMGASEASSGGYKEIIACVTGNGAFSKFKYERGVHRVQRVPETESQGRVHTSTVTVAVMPEAEDVEIEIDENDLKIDVYRSSGPGGQSVNTTDSAVRITHIPSGIVVAMQDEKSQHKNRDKAMRVLKARLLEKKEAEEQAARSAERKSQVGSGDRSEKIRTYNFPQSRFTDHRIGLTIHSLDKVMDGELGEVVQTLTTHYQAEALSSESDEGA